MSLATNWNIIVEENVDSAHQKLVSDYKYINKSNHLCDFRRDLRSAGSRAFDR